MSQEFISSEHAEEGARLCRAKEKAMTTPDPITTAREALTLENWYREYPEQEDLLAEFRYDPESGLLYRRKSGQFAGYEGSKGYWFVSFDNKNYIIHRIIWIMANGQIPGRMQVDHINHIKTDNRLENLRLATPSENMQNLRVIPSNKSGYVGVSWLKGRQEWVAAFQLYGRKTHLGFYDNIEAAAYIAAKARIDAGFIGDHLQEALLFKPHYDAWLARSSTKVRSRRARKGFVSGVHIVNGKYQAYGRRDGKRKYLGCFDTAESAGEAIAASQVQGFGQ